MPPSVREGLRRLESLAFSQIAGDDRFGNPGVSHTRQQEWIAVTRQLLNNHDGVESCLKRLEGQVEFSIKESNWPQ